MLNIQRILSLNTSCKSNMLTITGYVSNIRDLGKIKFLTIEDSREKIQVVIKELDYKFSIGDICKFKGQLQIKKQREFVAKEVVFLSKNNIHQVIMFNDDTKLSKRIDYLRKLETKRDFAFQSQFLFWTNVFFNKKNFFQLHTPLLSFDALEGSKLFVTKSVNYNDYFLSQSPQIYKQSLMSAGFERYFQIATCFRDENTRSDRQPEFLQLDFELSYKKRQYVYKLVESYISFLWKKLKIQEKKSFYKISYKDSIKNYFTDSPDFRMTYKKICVKNVDYIQIKEANKYNLDLVQDEDFFIKGNEIFFPFCNLNKTKETLKSFSRACTISNLIFVWVYDFPLFEEKDGKLVSCQNPFSKLRKKDEKLLLSKNKEKLLNILSLSFDLVLNGQEILGGSERNTSKLSLQNVFSKMGSKIQDLSFFFDLFDGSFPEHVGAAIGIQRFVSILLKKYTIRDIICFPKTNSGKCLFSEKKV